MLTPTPALRRRLGVAVLWMVALAAVIGFLAEPSTSTQYDAREGRGVLVTQGAQQRASLTATAAAQPLLRLVVAAILTLVVAAAVVLCACPDRAGRQLRSSLRWSALAHRGPPALV